MGGGWNSDGAGNYAQITLSGTSGKGNLSIANSGSFVIVVGGWVDYTK